MYARNFLGRGRGAELPIGAAWTARAFRGKSRARDQSLERGEGRGEPLSEPRRILATAVDDNVAVRVRSVRIRVRAAPAVGERVRVWRRARRRCPSSETLATLKSAGSHPPARGGVDVPAREHPSKRVDPNLTWGRARGPKLSKERSSATQCVGLSSSPSSGCAGAQAPRDLPFPPTRFSPREEGAPGSRHRRHPSRPGGSFLSGRAHDTRVRPEEKPSPGTEPRGGAPLGARAARSAVKGRPEVPRRGGDGRAAAAARAPIGAPRPSLCGAAGPVARLLLGKRGAAAEEGLWRGSVECPFG